MPNIDDYASIVGWDAINELYLLSERICGKVIQNVNSTSVGGGIAEILSRMIPFLKQLGVDANWETIKGDEKFFRTTKKIHNYLQGLDAQLTDEDLAYFLMVNQKNAEEIDFYGDIILIHDPQPIALVGRKTDTEKKMDLELPHRPNRATNRYHEFPK